MKASLRVVVIGGVVAGLLIPLSAATYFTGKRQAERLISEAKGDHERLTGVVAIGVQKALWDLAPEGAAPLVASVMGDGRVVRATILDGQGAVFHEAKEESRRTGDVLTLERPVVNGDQTIGKVVVEFSLAAAAQQVRDRLIESLAVAGVQALVCIAILVWLLNRRVLARLEVLKKQAKMLAAKSLDEPFVWGQGDEMEELGACLETTRGSLRELFTNLEGIVADRTATIKMILDHVRSGFFLVDKNLTVQAGYTKSCEALFGATALAGRPLTAVLGMDGARAEHYKACVDQVFDDIFPEDVSLEQVPRRCHVEGRTIALEGSTVRSADGQVGLILMTAVDVTALEAVEAENRANRSMIRILQNLTSFRDFVRETRERLATARSAVERQDDVVVRRELHTLKGNMSAFGLEELASRVHAIEDLTAIGEAQLSELESGVRGFLEARWEMLKIKYSDEGEGTVAVEPAALTALEREVLAAMPPARDGGKVHAAVSAWVRDVKKVPVESLMGPVGDYVTRLAEQRGKQLNFSMTGGKVRVDAGVFKPLTQTLVHLLRNSVDHGIEPIDERGDKDPVGHLELLFFDEGSFLKVLVRDDGKGIDAKRVLESAVRKGKIDGDAAKSLPEAQALDLIFLDGLSTAEAVTETSGRGVGMSAVREAVLDLGGRIVVTTKLGQGTEIAITVPVVSAAALRAA